MSDDNIIVRAENVTKVYRMGHEEVHALRGISLDITRGEYLSIMGPSGSGKSTFFNMIGGLDTPSSGNVTVEGTQLLVLIVVPLITIALWWLLGHTHFGEAVRAAATNARLRPSSMRARRSSRRRSLHRRNPDRRRYRPCSTAPSRPAGSTDCGSKASGCTSARPRP